MSDRVECVNAEPLDLTVHELVVVAQRYERVKETTPQERADPHCFEEIVRASRANKESDPNRSVCETQMGDGHASMLVAGRAPPCASCAPVRARFVRREAVLCG